MRVFQFWLPNTTWAMVEALGLTAWTVGTSWAMASKSAALRVFMVPDPLRIPQERRLPARIQRVLVPMAAISSWTCRCAPWPRLTMVMTAATPMMIPSMVRMERIMFRPRDLREIFKIIQIPMTILLD